MISESKFCRRALDDLFDKMATKGELVDNGPVTVPAIKKKIEPVTTVRIPTSRQ
jgi:hypothetical protein